MATTYSDSRLFTEDFSWGVATSAYQIEGAVDQEGRTPSIWDTTCSKAGAIKNNDTGQVACNHYHLYKSDIEIMQRLGVNSYRFSISWSRVMPNDDGTINPKGADFYHRLIDQLLVAGITPWITCYHWDLPQYLQDRYGGWNSKEVAKRFGEYSYQLALLYSSKVDNWITTNEIHVFTGQGTKGLQIVHNALLGHGYALQGIRGGASRNIRVGFAEAVWSEYPIYDTPDNIEAARKAFKYSNCRILFPLMEGRYSDEYHETYKEHLPEFTDQEMNMIGSPVDFVGYNIYSGTPVRRADNVRGFEVVEYPESHSKTSLGWNIVIESPNLVQNECEVRG